MNIDKLIKEAVDKKADYGWEIENGKEWDAFEDFREMVGDGRVAEELARAVGANGLGEILAFIFRQYGYNSPYLTSNNEDENEDQIEE